MKTNRIKNFLEDFEIELSRNGVVSKKMARKFIINQIANDEKNIDELVNLLNESKLVKKCFSCNKFSFQNKCENCSKMTGVDSISIFNSYLDVLEIGKFAKDGFESTYVIGKGNKNRIIKLDDIDFNQLDNFINLTGATELILMFDKNLKNDVLTDYLKTYYSESKVKVSTLALGVTFGSSIEYLDPKTIEQALKNREE